MLSFPTVGFKESRPLATNMSCSARLRIRRVRIQPTASFDFSFAAETTYPQNGYIKALSKRLEWQSNNPKFVPRFVKLDTQRSSLKTIDSYSQITRICHHKCHSSAHASINVKFVHWSSMKCKRVINSVRALEIVGRTHGFDSAAVMKGAIRQFLDVE